ncbi:hypothetical protein K491DRAFT_716565 [Lophiostoma macrostomum CBS 122681]|uniref:Myb-like domain-containing protein n=1 Tax=Lophiostoma macrostomum CBS 122681 TaxID=1314788 RepID=A0A6A6T7X9_9PLEO|nr:hypothetical protein K491DRAFT_716565 [Lophiostoma macrostomum CBS 122681]
MESQMATLLGEAPAHERTTLNPISLLPPPSLAPRKPLPVEPWGDYARTNNATPSPASQESQARQQKSRAPIAEVLNNDASSPASAPPAPQTSSTAPFSGRLSDILLDPSKQYPYKKRKLDGHTTPPALTGNENQLFTLPKLPQLPKKTARRPRIPPLLQGLHQPPPLPEGRLFPPITGETGGFQRDIGDRPRPATPSSRPHEKEQGRLKDVVPREKSIARKEHSQDKVGTPSPLAKDQEKRGGNDTCEVPNKADGKHKELRKRNKWSEQETKHLLQGVSKFGIGNWKKILNCPEFAFNQRTAVDLKDRFRTCCPDEVKTRKPRSRIAKGSTSENRPESPSNTVDNDGSASQEPQAAEPAAETMPTRKPRSDKHRKGPAELAELGIQEPFLKNKRRQRREFSAQDDENLLKGFEKYGAIWHSMRDDEELGFNARHPTDLRDRFRIRFPELFAKAGYKLKPKDELVLKGKEEAVTHNATGDERSNQDAEKTSESEHRVDILNTTNAPASGHNLRAHALLQPLTTSFPRPLDDFPDMESEDDGEANRSPVTLNRNILHWAGVNPSALQGTSLAPHVPSLASLPGDLGLYMYSAMDGMPLDSAPFKPPPVPTTANLSSTSHAYSTHTNANVMSTSFPLLGPGPPPTSSISTSAPPPTTATANKHTMPSLSLLRTPNLPTIVYPHVPATSARNTMHNLPPPADLLSGMAMDMDARIGIDAAGPGAGAAQNTSTGFAWDDGMGAAASSYTNTLPTGNAATVPLAPLVGAGGKHSMGIGMGWDKALYDEPFGERSVLNSGIGRLAEA